MNKDTVSYNPLSIHNPEISPNLLLMSKLIVIGLLLKGYFYGLSDHFLPLIPIFDYFGPPHVFERTLQAFFLFGCFGILLNYRPRLSCMVLGATLLTVTVSSMTSYRNSLVYCGFIMLFMGIHRKGETPWLIYLQIAILYFGAGLNKLLDPDWRSGQFFENWMHSIIQSGIYLKAATWFPPMALSKIMSWASIILELSACVGLLNRKFRPIFIALLICFHTTSMVLAGDFGVFVIAILSSYISFIPWPSEIEYKQLTGIKDHLLYSPIFYMGVAVFLATTEGLPRSVTALCLVGLMFPYKKMLKTYWGSPNSA